MSHLSSEDLDLLAQGSLPPETAGRARAHLVACAACATRRETLTRDAALSRQVVHAHGTDRGTRRKPLFPRWVPLALTVAVVLVMVLVVRPGALQRAYEDTRAAPVFSVVVARGGSQAELAPGAALQEGDRLRFRVDGAGASHVLVVSRDGAGAWSVFAPFGGAESAPLRRGAQVLPGAVELDATRGTGQLFAVFSDRPLRAGEVLAALKRDASASVPGARSVQRMAFEKR